MGKRDSVEKALANIDWASAEQFFYASMLNGWASGASPSYDVIHGYKSMSSCSDTYRLVDRWVKVSGHMHSSGVTTLYQFVHFGNVSPVEVPIWTMHYGGWYTDEAAEFVREVLRVTYSNPRKLGGVEKCGCRGSSTVPGELMYSNHLPGGATFQDFFGREYVTRRSDGAELGFHQYFGMSLV